MGTNVLVSGGSGFLGSFVIEELLARDYGCIYVLMRGESDERCLVRLSALWQSRPVLCDALGSRIVPVAGDITQENLGLAVNTYRMLASETGMIIHAAAEIGVNQTVKRFADANVTGTMQMLLFAAQAQANGGLERFVHVSSAYVAGTRTGAIAEDDLPETQFNSLYEHTKHAAEQLVRESAGALPVSIVRPGQIVGHTLTGFASTFNTLYYPLKLYLKGALPVAPVSSAMKVNLVPVDYVARVVVDAACSLAAVGKTFHATTTASEQPTVRELLDFVRSWAVENLRFDPGMPRFVPVPGAAAAGRARNLATSGGEKSKSTARNLLALAPYFVESKTFSTRNVEEVLGLRAPHWREYLGALLGYATRVGFLNHTGRNVFEQMLVRTTARTARIDYFDVSADGIRKTTGAQAREQIVRAARALRAQGIGPGDRVAIVGVNSVRYFVADAAIGLVGAASVPLYYTLPTSDIVDLVERSMAKLVFVGTEKLSDALPHALGGTLVSLLDAEFPGMQSWDDFMDGGADAAGPGASLAEPAFLSEPVPFDAVATIRYTSGTTGLPKGVMFTQGQLRWMGKVMPALLDWKTRNAAMRYLSFLPMSHVVEGILVAYAPYYMLTDVELYYLNDFGMLAEALPKVRPTIFFSVPRFYEKLWNQFESSGAGQRYLNMADGPAKRAFAVVARRVLLRKAGLDKCRQLIVGSAPVSMDLLESFRALGIEIHNAYGITEAPLVALSRLGENELGSVGALLPETQVRISGEGEILVAGPQVTVGYDGQGSCVGADGFFQTGDFGSLSEQGHLVIGGRKKELLVTSYGKNISPEKVETLLKSIPGVSEALLAGEGKPYVTALLWMEEGSAPFDEAALDAHINAVNERLSHPEQVKRWAVMGTSLSIAEGDLTPNLKLRRATVAHRYSDSIQALYEPEPTFATVAGALYVGLAQ